jgi:hypothetical protein
VHERLGAVPTRANSSHDPPFDPCALPKALQVIARAKDVSHPDTYPGQLWKHGSIRVIVVAVSPNTVTYEDLSRPTGITRVQVVVATP